MSNALSTAEALLERRRDNGCVENFPSVLRASNMVFERGELSRSFKEDAKGQKIRSDNHMHTITTLRAIIIYIL